MRKQKNSGKVLNFEAITILFQQVPNITFIIKILFNFKVARPNNKKEKKKTKEQRQYQNDLLGVLLKQ